MSSSNLTAPLVPACPDQVEPRDQQSGSGQPWINPTRCRERLSEVLTHWIIPRLQGLACRSVVLIPILDGGLSLYTEVERDLVKHQGLEGFEFRSMPIRTRSAHGGGNFELIGVPDDHKLLEGRAAVVIDDIADTGQTLESVLTFVRGCAPAAVLSFTFLVKPRTYRRPDFACFCVPDDLLLAGWGMDAGMGDGRHEQAIWDAADYIQHRTAMHRLVDTGMIRFAHSIGNATLARAVRQLVTAGNWQGRPDILQIMADFVAEPGD